MIKNKRTAMAQKTQDSQQAPDLARGTHGTIFHEGQTHVLPSNEVAKRDPAHKAVFPGLSDESRAYYTVRGNFNPTMADDRGWHWAEYAQKNTGGAVKPRQVVHEVEAEGAIDVDKNLNPGGNSVELTAPSLKITDTHWIPKVSDWTGASNEVQGTLPHVNWNQFHQDRGWGDGTDSYDTPPDHNYVDLTQQRRKAAGQRVIDEGRAVAPPQRAELPGQQRLPGH